MQLRFHEIFHEFHRLNEKNVSVFVILELVRVPQVPGIRRIFRQYCPAPDGFGNFTT